MARLKTAKSIDTKILECEEKLRKLKEFCVIRNFVEIYYLLIFPRKKQNLYKMNT